MINVSSLIRHYKYKKQQGEEIVSDYMQGVDCPYCEEGIPHTHRPSTAASVRVDGETHYVGEPPASEPSTEWSESVELVRAEMMRRFSNQLSMEQIASCAYAIATKFRANVRSQIETEREALRVAISKLCGSGSQKSPMYSCDEVEEIFRARKDGGK